MGLLHTLILGAVQGLTEFLPISSSGHLIIIPSLLGWGESPLVFDTSLHIGTALAVLGYFYKDLLNLNRKLLLNMALGSLPVICVGFFLGDWFEQTFRSVGWVILYLVIGSIVMYVAEKIWDRKKLLDTKLPGANAKATSDSPKVNDISWKSALFMGLVQPLALFPGMSRSGVTISGGLISGLDRSEAARMSFLLSLPAVVGAAVYELVKNYSEIPVIGYTPWLGGIFASFVVGYLSIGFLTNFLKTKSLTWFVIYRLFLAAVLLGLNFYF